MPRRPFRLGPIILFRLTCRSHSKFRRRLSDSSVESICRRVVRGVIGGAGAGRLYGWPSGMGAVATLGICGRTGGSGGADGAGLDVQGDAVAVGTC